MHLRRNARNVCKYDILQDLPTSSPKVSRQALLDCSMSNVSVIVKKNLPTRTVKDHTKSMQQMVLDGFDKTPLVVGRRCAFCPKYEPENKKFMTCPCRAGKVNASLLSANFAISFYLTVIA